MIRIKFYSAIIGVLFGSLVFAPMAQAGFLGAMIGAAIEHHGMEKEKQDGQQTLLTHHPVAAAAAGTVAGDATEGAAGFAVHEAIKHPLLAVGGAVIGVAAEPELAQKARDLYIEARTEKLRRNMAAAGDLKPGDGCAAHHIVMKDDGKFPASEHARKLLEKCGIDLDSAENGVWLPDTKEDSACHGEYHRTLHTEEYAIYVYTELRDAFVEKGCGGVREALQGIKESLQE